MLKKLRSVKGSTVILFGVIGIFLGIMLLILAKYMLTSFTISKAQTNRAMIVNYVGRGVLMLSILTTAFPLVKRAAKDILSK
jgi:xanthosine utilization system XapX-like protein